MKLCDCLPQLNQAKYLHNFKSILQELCIMEYINGASYLSEWENKFLF